ncbi:MAG: lysylphosphatidylglycerol synthase transmembrane domain-containing protein [Thermacetogeniaceae bacterium]
MIGPRKWSLSIWHVLPWLLLAAFAWLVVSRIQEIERLARSIARGSWQLILFAALLQVAYYLLYSLLYQTTFAIVELNKDAWELLLVLLSSLFINVVAPLGGMAGIALFADDASLSGRSPARATAGILLVNLVVFIAFSIILIAGLAYLFLLKHLQQWQVAAAIILLLSTVCLAFLLLLARWKPRLLEMLLLSVQKVVGRFSSRIKRPSPLGGNWAVKNIAEFASAARAIGMKPWLLGLSLLIAFIAHLTSMLSLYVVFLAFRNPISFPVLVAGYSMATLFTIISPTPQGIGLVEGIMPLVFRSLNVRYRTALWASLTFRSLTFWIPLMIGFFLFRYLRTFKDRK